MQTPYYLINEEKLLENYSDIFNAFVAKWPNIIIGYSFKTNSLPWVISRLKKEGAYAEVVSKEEFKLAQHLGYDPQHIIFNGPVKDRATLLYALENGSIVNLDNFSEVDMICSHTFSRPVKVGMRLNFDLEKDCPCETVAGDSKSRFGFCVENGEAERALQTLHQIPNINVCGLHGHNSTKTRSLRVFCAICSQLGYFFSKFLANVEYVDIGGCLFGGRKDFLNSQKYPSMQEYADLVAQTFTKYNLTPDRCKLIIEPGAAVVATAMDYYCKVLDIKEVRGDLFVTTDGTRLDVSAHSSSNLDLEVLTTKNIHNRTTLKQNICGYTCMEMDRFNILSPGNYAVEIGDVICVKHIGSYGFSLSPLFIDYFKDVYVTQREKLEHVRKKWSYKNYIQNCGGVLADE